MVAPPTNTSPSAERPIRDIRGVFISVTEAYNRWIQLLAIPLLDVGNERPSTREILDEMSIMDEIEYLQIQLQRQLQNQQQNYNVILV